MPVRDRVVRVFKLSAPAALLGLALVPAARVHGSSPMELTVSPAVSFAPSHVKIVVSVEPDPANRRLVVEAESAQFYRASEVTLNGADDPRTHSIEWREMPAGEYVVAARLHGTEGERLVIERPLSVYAGNGLPGE